MKLPPYGVEAIVKNYDKFLKDIGGMGGAVNETHKQIGGLGAISLGGLVSSAGIAVTAVAAIGTAALGVAGALGGLAIKMAIDAAPLYDIQTAFEGIVTAMGKDPAEVLRTLSEAARGTIPDVKLMENFNLASQLLGSTLSEKLAPVIPLIGKVASATGQDVGQLTSDFIRGIGRESVMILDNLGIQIDLTQVMDDYAKSVGTTAAELTKEQRQAALMSAATAALAKNTAAMPDIADTAAGAMKAFQTTITNTKDQIGMALVPALLPLITKLGELAQQYLPQLVEVFKTSVIPAVIEVATWIGEHLPGMIDAAVSFFGQMQTAGSNLAAFWTTTLQPAIVAVATYLNEKLGPYFRTVITILTDVVFPALKLLWQWFSVYILPIITTVANVISAVLGFALRTLWGIFTNLILPVVEKVWKWISEKLAPVFEWLGTAIQDVADFMAPFLEVMNGFSDWLNNVKLPEWLVGKSPSPFEKTLWGIAEAMGAVQSLAAPTIGAAVAAPVRAAPPGMGGAGGGAGASNAYNLTVNTSAPREPILADFRMMQALAGRR
jgi:hypothetical protein